MSPISVAQFLDPTCKPFDVVIFDEASQVRTEEAYGAFLRAKQAIVIGDTQQLPPTNFFDRMINDGTADGDGMGVADMESILHLCRTSFQTARLTWHYRSQHETLIAGSNQQFYDNSLRIYPSATDRAPGLGLEWRHLRKNLYDRGKSAINRGEAEDVADAVIEHYKTTPTVSLGVGTFSSKQQDAIKQEIELRLRTQPSGLEKYFNRDHHEHCFVKNLETIQGDERDVIYVSVGYGHTDAVAGRVSQSFGPVTNSGGERRLNVLFTRARRHCLIFSNFGADDLVVTQKSSRGVQVLQAFLKYAETRILPADTHAGVDPDSPFEESVAEVLRNKGHEVANQIGCAGYFIDLAVRDPDAPGRYVIGIECDGAQYHSSRVARDRDRLREEILRDRGWSIHRVWSTDWYRSRRAAEQRLLAAVDDALLHRDRKPPVRSEVSNNPFEGHIIEDSTPASGEPEGEAYQACESLERSPVGELHAQTTAAMREMIEVVVQVESPVCVELVISRIRTLWGSRKAGRLIREKVSKGIAAAKREGTIQQRGKFLWRADQTVPPVRRCGTARPPNLDFVCDEEITEAIDAVLQAEGTTPADALVARVARRLGIRSTSQKAAIRIRSLIMACRGAGDGRIL
jgi:very-short-patch-repair endonuclease